MNCAPAHNSDEERVSWIAKLSEVSPWFIGWKNTSPHKPSKCTFRCPSKRHRTLTTTIGTQIASIECKYQNPKAYNPWLPPTCSETKGQQPPTQRHRTKSPRAQKPKAQSSRAKSSNDQSPIIQSSKVKSPGLKHRELKNPDWVRITVRRKPLAVWSDCEVFLLTVFHMECEGDGACNIDACGCCFLQWFPIEYGVFIFSRRFRDDDIAHSHSCLTHKLQCPQLHRAQMPRTQRSRVKSSKDKSQIAQSSRSRAKSQESSKVKNQDTKKHRAQKPRAQRSGTQSLTVQSKAA